MITELVIFGTFLTQICSPSRSLCLSAVEKKCKEAAALKLPLSRLEVNAEDARKLFQVSSTSSRHHKTDDVRRSRWADTPDLCPYRAVGWDCSLLSSWTAPASPSTGTILHSRISDEDLLDLNLFDLRLCLRCGESISISNGPLLPHTGLLKAFKLLQVCLHVLCCSLFMFMFCFLLLFFFFSVWRLMPNFLCLISHGSWNLFDLDIFGTSVLWDTEWENQSVLIFIDPAGGGSFHIGLLLGRVGFHGQPGWKYQQQDVVFVRGQFPVLLPYKHTGVHQTCCNHPVFWLTPSSLSVIPSLSSLHVWNMPAVTGHTGQWDRTLGSDASPRCGLPRREGQAGMGEGAGGGEEARPQTHRNGRRTKKPVK